MPHVHRYSLLVGCRQTKAIISSRYKQVSNKLLLFHKQKILNMHNTPTTTDQMKYSCFTVDSIRLMAEAACLLEPSVEVSSTISEDATFRLRQIIARAIKFMRRANRTKLTCADINKALRWSDCQPVFGYQSNSNERIRYSYSAEAQVFRYEENIVDLVQRVRDSPKSESLLKEEMLHEAMPRLTIKESTPI